MAAATVWAVRHGTGTGTGLSCRPVTLVVIGHFQPDDGDGLV
jgi:hypothetical protein